MAGRVRADNLTQKYLGLNPTLMQTTEFGCIRDMEVKKWGQGVSTERRSSEILVARNFVIRKTFMPK